MKEIKYDHVPVQSLIDHIKTAIDVDPWAKEMAEDLLSRDKPMSPEIEGDRYSWWYVCSECHGAINLNDKFCHECGRRQKWDA